MDDLNIKKFEKLINEGLTLKEISIEMKISISSVKRKMIKYDLKSQFYSNKKESILCLNCKNHFDGLITEKRKFCSSSCSSIYNNQLRPKE
jgi:protein-arginine kinase activator protein McsA